MAGFAPPCPRCKDSTMVKDPVKGWYCPKCGYAPFVSDKKPAQPPQSAPSQPPAMQPRPQPRAPPPPVQRTYSAPPLPSEPRQQEMQEAAPRTLFPYAERQAFYEKQSWVESGKGVRFSRLIPLSVLPPGEPVKVQLLVYNAGNAVLAASFFVSLTNPNMQGMRLIGETLDIPPGMVFDVMHAISTTFLPGDYSLTIFCLPHPPTTSSSDPSAHLDRRPQAGPSPLLIMDGAIPPGLPGLYGVFKVRNTLACPSCQGAMQWAQEGMGGRPRSWVCGRCGFRLESGLL